MRGRTHAIFGITFALVLVRIDALSFTNPITGHGFLIFVLIGTLLPDIDHNESLIGRKLPIISKVIEKIFGHRGVYHSLYGLIFTIIAMYVLLKALSVAHWKTLLFATCLGFTSHLIMDSLTKRGVKWLPPFKFFHIKGPIRTGGLLEEIIFISLFLIMIILLFSSGFEILKII